jgi:hypothetical protein
VGVAVFGAIANATVDGGPVNPVSLTTAVHRIFIGIVLVAVVLIALSALIPRTADSLITESAPVGNLTG